MSEPEGRRYAGADADLRRERRRAELIASGLELFGTEGFRAVSVKKVCDHAGLTQRYFYESFADRSALLAGVYEDCVAFARSAVLNAAGSAGGSEGSGVAADDVPAVARAALGAFIGALAENPRRARVMLVEVVGVDQDLERLRLTAIHGWADLILMLARGEERSGRAERLASIALVGAVTQLLVDWYTSHTQGLGSDDSADESLFDLDAILDVSVELFTDAYARWLAP
ncbi:regulatory protein TetR [Gordonia bronchialis DSM 43247]|uniref:Regulatory protein TetR n=1 Tax=Gordonia bronchialis (strain ATCC 25592 / DSM 43247 / BCRC 13721 / JCM 3198 / KCTC 3076 / NBRC 16047 / NCTC 10667) TaxID=526226 RepID=D0L9B4_GORB4|nr:TetR/AcrR family transcriptional regulator [Gordonia bronchialis]ACY23959.1 regulatory protein TetR [Gordonia bronchialis DSM 43247]MCC3322127.1 TetR/AcrR family transcriptional regulator [Gordonia bronchialis]QGS26699.1 TetR family transcriptional regulator [Gordonia bronchialis]UAK36924.1 TetR/AcrR family transcriptional regulator [Gordonia bronchialis]STQ66989.1 mycofactocin system transcriptional regulator [Gordonia bronchialis]